MYSDNWSTDDVAVAFLVKLSRMHRQDVKSLSLVVPVKVSPNFRHTELSVVHGPLFPFHNWNTFIKVTP